MNEREMILNINKSNLNIIFKFKINMIFENNKCILYFHYNMIDLQI